MTNREKSMLKELLEVEEGLTDWEIGFLESMTQKTDRDLTHGQGQKLVDIWDKIFGGK